jgi:uncharacterized Zn finger protein (UPF0148 family)
MPVHNCDDHYLTMTDGSGRCGICGRHSSKSEMDAAYYRKQQAEIDRLRAALSAAIPALRAAYKGGHELTENDYETYTTAIQLTDPTPNPDAG